MAYYVVVSSDTTYRPNRWRWLIIALGALIMCGCQLVGRSNRTIGNITRDAPGVLAKLDLAELLLTTAATELQLAEPPLVKESEDDGNDFYRMSDRAAAPLVVARNLDQLPDVEITFVDDAEPEAGPLDEQQVPEPPTEDELRNGDGLDGDGLLDESLLRRDDSAAVSGPCSCVTCRPNLVQRWGQPRDEYICDGADSHGRVVIRKDFSIKAGLDPADTVAHYDTLAGKRKVQASTRACIYAPRFAAARKIVRVATEDSIVRAAPIKGRDLLVARTDHTTAGQVKLPEAVQQQIDNTIGHRMHQYEPAKLRENVLVVQEARRRLLPFENLEAVRSGVFADSESALLEAAVNAAIAWSSATELQITIQGLPAFVSQANFAGQEVLLYESEPGAPDLRVLKLASKCEAQSGETVHFTIRFDNTGNEAIGNVTIIDNLPARLEYVESSADCSVAHELLTEVNAVGSQTLRFEITEPLEPGQGGIVRFRCLVR